MIDVFNHVLQGIANGLMPLTFLFAFRAWRNSVSLDDSIKEYWRRVAAIPELWMRYYR